MSLPQTDCKHCFLQPNCTRKSRTRGRKVLLGQNGCNESIRCDERKKIRNRPKMNEKRRQREVKDEHTSCACQPRADSALPAATPENTKESSAGRLPLLWIATGTNASTVRSRKVTAYPHALATELLVRSNALCVGLATKRRLPDRVQMIEHRTLDEPQHLPIALRV